jgi:RecA/RadA recombinase
LSEKLELESIKGIGDKTAAKLREHGVSTVEQLVLLRPEELAAILGVNLLKAKEILIDARDKALSKAIEVWTGQKLKEYREKHVQRIPTGIPALDVDFGGGLPTDCVISVAGASATGKSQLMYTLAVNAIGLLKRPAFLIETEPSTLSIERILEIASAKGVEIQLDKDLFVIPAKFITSPYTQYLAYEMVRRTCREKNVTPALIGVDSFTSKFRGWYGGRETLPLRSQEIARHMTFLQELASEMNACVYLSEQVYGIPDTGGQIQSVMKFGDARRIYGGEYLLHAPSICLMLTQTKADEYSLVTFDVPFLPRKEYPFRITKMGVTGV